MYLLFRRLSYVVFCLLLVTTVAPIAAAHELTGVVRTAEGEPAAGATVRLPVFAYGDDEPAAVATAVTNDDGRFDIVVPEPWFDLVARLRSSLVLSVHSEQFGYGGVVVYSEPPLPRRLLEIRLTPPATKSFRFRLANGKPAAGVDVKVTTLLQPVVYPERFSATAATQSALISPVPLQPVGTTDDQGVVELQVPSEIDVASVAVQLRSDLEVSWSVYSSQQLKDGWPAELSVPKLVDRALTVQANAAALKQLRLKTTSYQHPAGANGFQGVIAVKQRVSVDKEGSATLSIVEGTGVQLQNVDAGPSPNLLHPMWLTNASGDLEVNFDGGVQVAGRLVSAQGEPVAVQEFFSWPGQLRFPARTDAQGRFHFRTAPGAIALLSPGRSGYRGQILDPESLTVVTDEDGIVDLGDIQWTKLAQVNGTVVSEGQPVAHATVHVLREDIAPQAQSPYRSFDQVQTDEQGRFTIRNLEPGKPLQIAAVHDGQTSSELRMVSVDHQNGPVQLQLFPDAAITVGGQLVDGQGRGVAGARVVILHRLEPPLTAPDSPTGTQVLDQPLVTDADGRYVTPKVLPPWGVYVAVVNPGTKQEMNSGWRPAKSGSPLQLPALESWQTTEVAGRVLTAAGSPVPDARVSILTSLTQAETATDENGDFKLQKPGGRMPLLIVEADGFMANGLMVSGSKPVNVTLYTPDDAASQRYRANKIVAAPETWRREEQVELALRLADGISDAEQRTKMQVKWTIARSVPDRILAELDSLPAAHSPSGQRIRGQLALGLAEDRPEQGLQILEELPDDAVKMMMAISFANRATLEEADRIQLLGRIVQGLRGTDQAPMRVVGIGLVAECLLDHGHQEQGAALLRDALEDARQLAPTAFAGYARGAFAEELAQIDIDAALELIEPLKDVSEFNRHTQNVAHEVATIDPDRAIAIVDMLKQPPQDRRPLAGPRDLAALRVCYRMIRVAPDKAVALAKTIEAPSMKAYGFQLMADSLLKQDEVQAGDREVARRVHDEAWQVLTQIRKEQDLSEVAWLYPSTIAGLLLPITKEVAPDELSGRVWQTLALRRPLEKSGSYQLAGYGCVSELATSLLEFDRHLAAMVGSWVPAPGSRLFPGYVNHSRTAAELIAGLHPEQCEAALESISDAGSQNRLRHALINGLLRTGESKARAIRSDMALWFPDDEDLGPIE